MGHSVLLQCVQRVSRRKIPAFDWNRQDFCRLEQEAHRRQSFFNHL